jgi:ABC-type transport system involved in cytochrome c biogenesis permease subunit
MLSGVSITCFTASYGIVLALELTRLLFRSGVRGAVLLGFAGAGLLAHTIYLSNRAIHAAGSPLSSQKDWYLMVAWVLVAAYLYFTAYHRKTALGVFVLPLVLGLVGVAAFVADETPLLPEQASRVWGLIHGTAILLATVAVSVGFVFGLMYLLQARMLRKKLPPPRGLRLPSLEWLQRTNSQAVMMSAPLMAVGVLTGMVLNLLRDSERMPWRDPLTLATVLMFIWLTAAAGASLFYKPVRQGRKLAYLTIASFVFLVSALGVGLFADTSHGKPGLDETPPPEATSGSPISGVPISLGELPRETAFPLRDAALGCAKRGGAPATVSFLPRILQSGCPSSRVAGGIA